MCEFWKFAKKKLQGLIDVIWSLDGHIRKKISGPQAKSGLDFDTCVINNLIKHIKRADKSHYHHAGLFFLHLSSLHSALFLDKKLNTQMFAVLKLKRRKRSRNFESLKSWLHSHSYILCIQKTLYLLDIKSKRLYMCHISRHFKRGIYPFTHWIVDEWVSDSSDHNVLANVIVSNCGVEAWKFPNVITVKEQSIFFFSHLQQSFLAWPRVYVHSVCHSKEIRDWPIQSTDIPLPLSLPSMFESTEYSRVFWILIIVILCGIFFFFYYFIPTEAVKITSAFIHI